MDNITLQTNNLIVKANVLAKENGYNFFVSNQNVAVTGWVYRFLQRWDLSLRCITRVGQKSSGNLESVRHETVTAINERFREGGALSNVTKRFC